MPRHMPCRVSRNSRQGCVSSSDGAALTTAQIAGIIVGVVIFFALSSVALFAVGRRLGAKDRKLVDEAEMQLLSARQESAESKATVRRILAAWEIPAEHITFLQQLAEGSYGAVWKGLWGSQPVAIKVLKGTVDDELGAEDFRKECETLQSIKHPNLLVFFGAGTTADGKAFMVTEFMSGGSLRRVLHDPLTTIDWLVRVRIAQQIAAGMRHLHSLSIVHRDLKSDNVLLNGELHAKVGHARRARPQFPRPLSRIQLLSMHVSRHTLTIFVCLLTYQIADFGTSKIMSAIESHAGPEATAVGANDGSVTMTKAVGTQLWMAPEVFFGQSRYGSEVDVYSFGIIMWELATRKNPWYELDAQDYITQFRLLDAALRDGRRPTLPNGFEAEHAVYAATLRKCWATDPSARPSFEAVMFSLALVPSATARPPEGAVSLVDPQPTSRHVREGLYATVGDAQMRTHSNAPFNALSAGFPPACRANRALYESDDAVSEL
jgi:serine/threonine protein kinase